MHPLTWFQERIGRKIVRDITEEEMTSVVLLQAPPNKEILIRDDFHAQYLHMIQCDYHAEGVELNYRDANK